ncbi:MAG TPA: hypothetical protein VNW92_30285, partial [Polyangiaceae bacterium]|nr:hypothetical protein [Polyangiaceae bacterium]
MSRPSGLVILSLAVHGALAVGVGSLEIKKSHATTAIEYAETQKKKAPEPAKVDPTPPEKAPPARALARRAAPEPVLPEPPTKPAPNPAFD